MQGSKSLLIYADDEFFWWTWTAEIQPLLVEIQSSIIVEHQILYNNLLQ